MTDEAQAGVARTRRRGGRRPSLTPDDIHARALAIADAEGLDALTMQRLARELGVGVMTLYGYVRTKDDIYDGIARRVFGQLVFNPVDGAQWQDQLVDALTEIRALATAHPGALQVLLTPHSLSGPAMNELGELLLNLLQESGLRRQDAVDVIGASASFTVGFLAVESARRPASAETEPAWAHHMSEDTFQRGLRRLLRVADADADRPH